MRVRKSIRSRLFALALICVIGLSSQLLADPCGMVPPIYTGPGSPIARIGLQQTYVFYDDGVESFVIRPGFEGKVDNFGMLIPFPTPPALRKVPDNVFDQIAAAVDPPEVVVNLLPLPAMEMAFGAVNKSGMEMDALGIRDQVQVLRQEAVGMYEVAVLAAGSPAALKRWMDENKYVYPTGMDNVTLDYINEGWCFVAVKTRVGAKANADPRPGQRNAKPEMPSGSVFDGNVQGLGFRFKSDQLVVPMRLSAFNEGELRNVVYLLTRGGKKINAIPEEYVVRQIAGKQLVENMTQPLPLRVIGGTEEDIPEWRLKNLAKERDPEPHNGAAKQLFTSDILAKDLENLSMQHEETEKELLRIGEHFGLRGAEIDAEIGVVIKQESDAGSDAALPTIEQMTLTVIDGDFPREVIANQNLTFADFQMAARRNNDRRYDTKLHGPAPVRRGRRVGNIDFLNRPELQANPKSDVQNQLWTTLGAAGLALLILISVTLIRKSDFNKNQT